MATRARGEKSAADDDFTHNLYKGGELLAAGKVIEAKDYLEKAFKLQPKNEKGQNLLGLAYFKLGLFDRAAEIYELLVRDNPVDATLRVNLGLVYLKTNQLQRAIREFETSCDLAPDHKKAHNYLGLALAQIGNYSEAKDHFIEAGSEAMVQKMERALAGEATGLHRMPAPLEQQKAQKFAEIEGSEIVAERGGQQIHEVKSPPAPVAAPPPPPPPPPEEVEIDLTPAPVTRKSATKSKLDESWGAQFGEEAASSTPPEATADEDDMRMAADEGPSASELKSAPRTAPQAAPPRQDDVVMSPEDLGASAPIVEAEPESEPEGAPEVEVQVSAEQSHHPAPALQIVPEEPSSLEAAAQAAPVAEHEAWEAGPLRDMKSEAVLGLPIAELAPTLEMLKGAVAAPFEVRSEGALVAIDGEILTRIEGMLFVTGAVKFEPEMKRFRGRTTDQTFGEGDGRMTRASGRGVLLVGTSEKLRFVTVDLAEESAYFREEVIYAFEEAVMFENGRVPSETTGDLDLVHLRGKGKVLLKLDGSLRARQVRMDEPATVPLARLVGWFGNVTPKLVTLAVEESGKLVKGGAELSGEGWVLFSVP